MKALARLGVARVPGGRATPSDRIHSALDWPSLFLPALVLIGEMLQLVLAILDSFRS